MRRAPAGDRPQTPGALRRACGDLARHGLRVDVHRVPGEDIAVAEAILSYASDAGADLLVMGGYEHSRLREFLLGGATRGVLEAMTIPVLMSH